MIHTVKGFSILNEGEVDVFLEFPCFFYDPADVGNLISGSSAFSKTSLNIWTRFTYCWSLAWRILSITWLACEMSAIVQLFEHSLALPFFGIVLCDPMDYLVHGILQARILEWVAVPFSRGSFQPRDQTQISHIAGRLFTSSATRDPKTRQWRSL